MTKSLTHWVQVMHICVIKLTIIGSDNGLSPGRHQAIIWTNDGILLTGTLGTNFNEILIEIHTFPLKNPFENVVWKMASILSQPQCVKADPGHSITDMDCLGSALRWQTYSVCDLKYSQRLPFELFEFEDPAGQLNVVVIYFNDIEKTVSTSFNSHAGYFKIR